MIQVTPHMRVLVAVEPVDFRRGIDGLARVCREVLHRDPFSGWVFVFRNRRAKAIKHWKELTLFLRVPGAPLDNNICERALKKAILHRKNAYFYKTENGARVGDLFMSLIHTCRLNGANPFRYLTELQKHAGELAAAPADWMPWNCLRTLESGQGRPSG